MEGKSGTVFSIKRGLFLASHSSVKMKFFAGGVEMPIKMEGKFELVEKKK